MQIALSETPAPCEYATKNCKFLQVFQKKSTHPNVQHISCIYTIILNWRYFLFSWILEIFLLVPFLGPVYLFHYQLSPGEIALLFISFFLHSPFHSLSLSLSLSISLSLSRSIFLPLSPLIFLSLPSHSSSVFFFAKLWPNFRTFIRRNRSHFQQIRACHGWSRCNGICQVFWGRYVYGNKSRTYCII